MSNLKLRMLKTRSLNLIELTATRSRARPCPFRDASTILMLGTTILLIMVNESHAGLRPIQRVLSTSLPKHPLPVFLRQFTREQIVLMGCVIVTLIFVTLLQPEVLIWIASMIRLKFRRRQNQSIRVGAEWISDNARLRHTHIVGATGTGKTVLIEKLLFEDLNRGYGAVIIDPKGERSFYDSVRSHCESIRREKDLKFLSATFGDESSIWNPCGLGNASELQTKFFNSAIYSEPHYAKACEFGLLQAFRQLTTASRQGFTIRELLRELKNISEDDKHETLKGLFFDLNNLVYGEWEKVLACGKKNEIDPKKEVSLLDVISQNKILFVDLPTEGKKVQSSRIGRLLTQEIILISGMRKRNPSLKSDRPFSVYIDEFDAFATESFSTFLNKGRSSEFMIHLAHQTLSDLNTVSPEFTGQILGNCNVRFIFRQDDPDDAERWSRFIGTKKVIKQTYRSSEGVKTGESSNREALEFIVAPDKIKSLRVGECVFSMKTEGQTRVIKIPFKPATLINSAHVVQCSEQRGIGRKEERSLNVEEIAPARMVNEEINQAASSIATTDEIDKWALITN
jgi:hypothetical protein